MLWKKWWDLAQKLQGACARKRTFLWMIVCLMGMTVRADLTGVTSIIRAMGLLPSCYDRILDFFHSPSLCLDKLTRLWRELVLGQSSVVRVNGRPVIVGDGIKIAKSGKKMPGVKKLHQQSESNTKPEYIFGHSCQAVAILVQAAQSVFAVPMACRIHEGVIFSNRDKRTLLDKMILLLDSLDMDEPFFFIADAYYASGKTVRSMLARGNHLITRVKSNAVAFDRPESKSGKRGRPQLYGAKIRLASLLENEDAFQQLPSPIYGETGVMLSCRAVDLLWRPAGMSVRFVIVRHPSRGVIFLMSTDLNLAPLEIIKLYALRFKIELSFKQALRVVGTFAYHFWMNSMTTRKTGNQHLHKNSESYRSAVKRKLDAYHRHIQLGIISQGLLQILSATSLNPGLAFLRFLDSHNSPRPGSLRTGYCYSAQKYPPRFSLGLQKRSNPYEIPSEKNRYSKI